MPSLEKIEQELLFNFNDTNKIKIGKNIHMTAQAADCILIAAEQNNTLIPFGINYCKINNQIYRFKQKLSNLYGAETVNIVLIK